MMDEDEKHFDKSRKVTFGEIESVKPKEIKSETETIDNNSSSSSYSNDSNDSFDVEKYEIYEGLSSTIFYLT